MNEKKHWKLIIGQASYQELIEESKRQIHRLDFLPFVQHSPLQRSLLKIECKDLSKAAQILESIYRLSEQSSKKELKRWATNLEILGDKLEDNLSFLSFENFRDLQSVCEAIVIETRKKGDDPKSQKESYRRRLRYAAGFILNLIEIAEEEAKVEDEKILNDFISMGSKALDDLYREDEKAVSHD